MSTRTLMAACAAATLFSGLWPQGDARAEEPLKLYIDADYSISWEAANAIELGVRTALDEVGYTLGGQRVEVAPQNHKANAKRSYKTLKAFLKDDNALAIFGGMHSPPYLTYKDFINENRILMLLPWSAAGPITRAGDGAENWIFRLSVDDSKAGGFLVNEAVVGANCSRVALLLVDTGWGRSNQITMTEALARHGMEPAYTHLFATTIGEEVSKTIAANVRTAGADCVIMLANATEGAHLTHALNAMASSPKIFSHWGILGRDYPVKVGHAVRRKVDLKVLQTCGLRAEAQGRPTVRTALDAVESPIDALADIPAPTGFIHGYDLTRILIAAAEQAAAAENWGDLDVAARRAALKAALEGLRRPVEGILRTYDRPFGAYGPSSPDAHEALGAADLCMAAFREDGRLRDASTLQ